MGSDPFTDEAIKVEARNRLRSPRSKKPEDHRSSICAVLWGYHDSLKSGIAMDSRSWKQIQAGEKVIIFDLDDANEPLWRDHWNMSEDIIVVNPVVWEVDGDAEDGEEKKIDYDKTLAMIHELVLQVEEWQRDGTVIASAVFDGIDSLLESSEQVMRDHHDIEVDEGAHYAMWRRRNKIFNDIVVATKSLSCAKYFITHVKNLQKKKNDKVIKEWEDGDWEKKFPNKMWQIVLCEKEMDTEDETTKYYATVMKFKGHPELVGRRFCTMEITNGKVDFHGLPVLRDTHNWEEMPGVSVKKKSRKIEESSEEAEELFA